jgi:hypothetical protein
MTAEDRLPLGDTGWSVWSDALLRSAGFPADGLTTLSAPAAAAAADARLRGEQADFDTDFDAEFDAAVAHNAARLLEIAADPLVREAVTWQNTNALYAFVGLVETGPDAPRNSRLRVREKAVVKYWQRY